MAEKTRFWKGHFLLDSGELGGSFFARTAVLLCQHDADGAFGLILNRVTDKKVGDVLLTDLPEALREAPLFIGGPVQSSALSFLHADILQADGNVLPNLHLGHSLDELAELGQTLSPTSRIRIFAGYAGWSPGQLEGELKRKAWLTHPATVELVFDTPPEELWRTLVRLKGGWRNRLLATLPEDPSLN
jgi:putative transcriptional regulator